MPQKPCFGSKTGKSLFKLHLTRSLAPFELYADIEEALCFLTVLGQANSQITSRVTLSISGITTGCFL